MRGSSYFYLMHTKPHLIYDIVSWRFPSQHKHLVQYVGCLLDERFPPAPVVLLASKSRHLHLVHDQIGTWSEGEGGRQEKNERWRGQTRREGWRRKWKRLGKKEVPCRVLPRRNQLKIPHQSILCGYLSRGGGGGGGGGVYLHQLVHGPPRVFFLAPYQNGFPPPYQDGEPC